MPQKKYPHFIGYIRLMRLDKPIGILLLLWPTLWALLFAGKGHPDLKILSIFILGGIIMRSAGCVINDIADRNFDGEVTRTKQRPLITGNVTVKQALILFIILCLCAFSLVLLLNRLTIILSLGGLLLAIIYPFMKRFTYLPQFFLGATFNWGVPMAFAAQTGAVPIIAWQLYLTAMLWSVVYDTMYAMVDRTDDLRIGVKSTAILFGRADKLIIGLLQAIVLILLLYIGIKQGLNHWYFLGGLIAAVLAIYQQYLIKDREPKNCFKAFLNNNWFGLAIFLGLWINYL